MRSLVERLRVTRRVVKDGGNYIIDATLYRRVAKSPAGRTRRTDWSVDSDNSRVDPDPTSVLRAEMLAEVEAEVRLASQCGSGSRH